MSRRRLKASGVRPLPPAVSGIESQRRVFFALRPEAATAQALAGCGREVQLQSSGRLMRTDSLHLTLAFIGDVEAGRLLALLSAAQRVLGETFVMQLDWLAGWPRQRLLWAGMQQPPRALMDLAAGLRAALEEAGFALEQRAFVPHVTLLRNLPAAAAWAPRAMPPLPWRVQDFVLLESLGAGVYRPLGRWPLMTVAGFRP